MYGMVIISALSFSAAFWCMPYVPWAAWAIIFWWIPLWNVHRSPSYNVFHALKAGMFWGGVVYSIHFIWLFVLLLTKSNASPLAAGLLYGGAVFYYTVLTILFFLMIFIITPKKNRPFALLFWLGGWGFYFIIIERYSLSIFESGRAYPFISPVIPLMACIETLFPQQGELPYQGKIYFLKLPLIHEEEGAAVAAQKIYQALALLKLEAGEGQEPLIIIAPESTYPYALNENPEAIRLWSYVLPEHAYFLLGALKSKIKRKKTSFLSVFKPKEKWYQSLYLITNYRITQTYDKQYPTLLSERIPKKLREFMYSYHLFLRGKIEISQGKKRKIFIINKELLIEPFICSDLFLQPLCYAPQTRNDKDFNRTIPIPLVIANDTWFIKPFRTWMKNYITFKATLWNRPIIYCSHHHGEIVIPIFKRKVTFSLLKQDKNGF